MYFAFNSGWLPCLQNNIWLEHKYFMLTQGFLPNKCKVFKEKYPLVLISTVSLGPIKRKVVI
jgi:hypothetical protein